MSAVGGSANINGIVYQIVGALNCAVTIHLRNAECTRDEVVQAQLIIEPASGGDLQFETPAGRVVQQWKAKARGGTWSLKKLVEDVLPDLYLAIPGTNLNSSCTYQLVTEAVIGDWEDANRLFKSLTPTFPEAGLSNAFETQEKHKRGQKRLSDLELFQWMVETVRKRKEVKDEDLALTERKVWHLLARFEMKGGMSHEAETARLNQFLSHHVEFSEDVDAKRRELCGVLYELASQGPQQIDSEELLRKASIPLYSFRDWPRLRGQLRDRLSLQLDKDGYDGSSDVRLEADNRESITVLTGGSGQGKTWRLAAIALSTADSSSLVVWVPSTREITVADYVAKEVWNIGLQRDQQVSLETVVRRHAESRPNQRAPWLVVCVDDVRSKDEADAIARLDWEHWGIRLVLSVSTDLASHIALSQSKPTTVVTDFTHEELRTYLTAFGFQWMSVAPDVRELIRRPVLASIFSGFAETASEFSPANEYELMEAAWNRIPDAFVRAHVRKIAGTLHEQESAYPWTIDFLIAAGFSRPELESLVDCGWVRFSGQEHLVFSHPRFLCWAYASWLHARYQAGTLTLDQLATQAESCFFQQPWARRLSLGYVPMDLLWLVFNGETSGAEWKLIVALEGHRGTGHGDSVLYSELLATLGIRAIAPIVQRVLNIEDTQKSAIPVRAAEALAKIGDNDPAMISQTVSQCLEHNDESLVELGIRLSARFPNSDVERVWDAYKSRILAPKQSAGDYVRQEKASNAFRAVVARNTAWLETKLLTESVESPGFKNLAFALGRLDGCDAASVWTRVRDRLLKEIPPEDRRSLIGCITTFGDSEDLQCLREWVASDHESVGGTALLGLAYRDPVLALGAFRDVGDRQLLGLTSHIGRALGLAVPDAFCEELLELADARPNLVDTVQQLGDLLSPEVFNLVIRWLNAVLQGTDPAKSPWKQLAMVDGLHGRTGLHILHQQRETSLARNLLEFALTRVANVSNSVDHEFQFAISLLQRIGGTCFSDLVVAMIESPCRHTRLRGCELAIVRPTDAIASALTGEALSDEVWDSNPGSRFTQLRAMDALAAIGANEGLVTAILKWGEISLDLKEYRRGHPPMADSELGIALRIIVEPENPAFAHAVLAIGVGGRPEHRSMVEDALLDSTLDSDTCRLCLYALEMMPGNCERVLDRLVSQYQSGHFKYAVSRVISNYDLEATSLIRLLPKDEPLDDNDSWVVEALLAKGVSREEVEGHIDTLLSNDRTLGRTTRLLDPSDERHRRLLWSKALDTDQSYHFVGSRAHALKLLGETAPDAAFEIGISTLTNDRRDRDSIPGVLLGLDPARAVQELCAVACQAKEKVLCSQIGRAIRGSAEAAAVGQVLVPLLSSAEWTNRRTAAYVASFLGGGVCDDELRHMAYGDPSWEVCAEAQKAIRAHQREVEASELCRNISKLHFGEVWGALDCIFGLVDPCVLSLECDPIGFLAAIRIQPFALRKYAGDLLKKSEKEAEKNMTSLHGKWKFQDL